MSVAGGSAQALRLRVSLRNIEPEIWRTLNWPHDLTVEERLPTPKGKTLPRCTAGARSCPPEDCGGSPGYFELLEALHDVKHSEHESYKEWIGGEFDPESFDLERANAPR